MRHAILTSPTLARRSAATEILSFPNTRETRPFAVIMTGHGENLNNQFFFRPFVQSIHTRQRKSDRAERAGGEIFFSGSAILRRKRVARQDHYHRRHHILNAMNFKGLYVSSAVLLSLL